MKKIISIALVISMIIILCACDTSKDPKASIQVVTKDWTNEDVFIASGDSKITPLSGIISKTTKQSNGTEIVFDGTGVANDIAKLKTNSYFEAPTIQLDGNVEIQIGANSTFGSISYINPSVSWDINNSSFDEIASLDKGDYYVIITVTTITSEFKENSELLFKLSVTQ